MYLQNIMMITLNENNIEGTNKELKAFLDNENTIIIDWNDLNQSFNQFKIIFQNKTINILVMKINMLCV